MVETGTSGVLHGPALPAAMFWGSIVTGRPPSSHGIVGELEVRPDRGGVQPVSARSWRATPVWRILATEGVATAVIGWPATAPAATWQGCVVDDRFARPAGSLTEDWPLPPDCIAPKRLRAVLRGLRVHPEELDDSATGSLPPALLAAAASVHAAATHIAEHEPWRFLTVYYGLLAQVGGDLAWRFQDAMLGRLLALAGPDTDAIVVSPGGVLVAAGPGFAADVIVHGAGVADIVPTVLARFGLSQAGGAGRTLEGTKCGDLRRVVAPPMPTPSPGDAPPASPAAAPLIADVEYRALLHLGSAALAAGDHAAAAGSFEAVLALRPDDFDARFQLGQCRFFLGDWPGCLELGRALAEAVPASPWGPMMVGAALALGGDALAAAPHLRAASRLAGRNPAAHVRLGAVAMHLGRFRDAEAHYAQALAIDPRSADARAGFGLARLALGDASGAEASLRASLGLQHHAPALHHQLGLLFAAQRRWPEAAAALRVALAQHPDLADAATLLRRVETELAATAGHAGA